MLITFFQHHTSVPIHLPHPLPIHLNHPLASYFLRRRSPRQRPLCRPPLLERNQRIRKFEKYSAPILTILTLSFSPHLVLRQSRWIQPHAFDETEDLEFRILGPVLPFVNSKHKLPDNPSFQHPRFRPLRQNPKRSNHRPIWASDLHGLVHIQRDNFEPESDSASRQNRQNLDQDPGHPRHKLSHHNHHRRRQRLRAGECAGQPQPFKGQIYAPHKLSWKREVAGSASGEGVAAARDGGGCHGWGEKQNRGGRCLGL